VIIIKNKKLLLSLGVFFVAFLFTGCYLFNSAPVIESNAVTTATEGALYIYGVEATDPEGDTLTYSLTAGPTGMTINSSTGVINWTPTEVQIGANEVEIKVSDLYRSTTQSFTITVGETILTSIVVLPATMTVKKSTPQYITSVTAHYDNGTEANIALNSCTYVSNKPANATVNSNGLITGIANCSGANAATITVSYTEDGITETDTVLVSVT
jgi:hypothetical protein